MKLENRIKVIECPRDAMQGIHHFISTDDKVRYINQLLKVNFDTLDMGSFVSEKAIPQLKDTPEVLERIDTSGSTTKLLTIVANQRGAERAVQYDQISYLGFPFSISATFQQRNINSTIDESLRRLETVNELCIKHDKKLVTYFSMAFGNPYGDEWSAEIVAGFAEKLINEYGVKILSMSDTIGTSNPDTIAYIFSALRPYSDKVDIGAHLHTTPDKWEEKIAAAIDNGCVRFDSAMKGYGGCPMAKDDLTGNMPTENLLSYLTKIGANHGLNEAAFYEALRMAEEIFPH
jgi:hydroxymethylglutaryl-CoA lyase